LAGFLAKLYVFGAAVEAGLVWLAVIGVINSVISAYYYLRVVAVMFLQERERAEDIPATVGPAVQVGLGVAAAAIVVLGLWPAPILDLARQAAVAFFGG
jgi:NADH-quinone oxidoreductase subunit N